MMNSVVAFTGLSEGEALKEDFVESIFMKMEEAVDTIDIPDKAAFPFEQFTGTWSFQHSDSSWTRSSSPSNKIVVEFPSDDAQNTNNTVATLEAYVDQKFTFDLEDVWLPKSFEFTLVKDGSKIGGIKLNNFSMEQSNDIAIPTDIDGEIFMAPFTIDMKGERVTSKEFMVKCGMDDGSGCEYTMESTVKLKHDDYENLEGEDIVSIDGKIGHNDLLLDIFVDAAKISELESQNVEITDDHVNDNIQVDVKMKGTKIANLEIEGSETDEPDVIIVYKDNTSESTSVYFEPFAEDVEALFKDLTGAWDDGDDQVQVQ